ncbi:MAG: SPOR domain-containing protein [bacterium]
MTDMDRGKDYEPDIYATHEEDYDDFDVEEEEEGGSRAAVVLIIVIGMVLLLGVGFVSYRVGFDNGQREASVPRLQAANEGGKVQPDNPGGMEPPPESELDESVTGGSEDEFANLQPREEEVRDVPDAEGEGEPVPGVDVPITLGADPDSAAAEPDSAAAEPEDAPDSVPVEAPESPEPAEEPPPAPEPESQPQPSTESSGSTSGRIMVPKPGASVPGPSDGSSDPGSSGDETVPAPSESSTSSPPAPSGAAPSAGTSGDYVVQLASLPSEEAADSAWRTMSAKFPDLLGDAFRDVQEADLGERGIFYRLRVGYFGSKSEADRLCDTLKSRGQDCLVKTR